MSLDKILSKIQVQIEELAPTLELFVEDSIQPSVKDCENLQQQLNKIQENLSVYKYYKQERELSPSFNIHSKVSEKNLPLDKKEEIDLKEKEILSGKQEEEKIVVSAEKTESAKSYPVLTIAINDKFRLINELFKQNGAEYNIAVEQLNALNSWNESELYLNSLKMIYNWKENSEVVTLLYALVKKRFA